MKYTDKKLEYLATADLIWPKKSELYRRLLKQSIIDKGWDYKMLDDQDETNDIIHDELWYDVCEIINDLARMLIDERAKTGEIVENLKAELRSTLKELTKIAYS